MSLLILLCTFIKEGNKLNIIETLVISLFFFSIIYTYLVKKRDFKKKNRAKTTHHWAETTQGRKDLGRNDPGPKRRMCVCGGGGGGGESAEETTTRNGPASVTDKQVHKVA